MKNGIEIQIGERTYHMEDIQDRVQIVEELFKAVLANPNISEEELKKVAKKGGYSSAKSSFEFPQQITGIPQAAHRLEESAQKVAVQMVQAVQTSIKSPAPMVDLSPIFDEIVGTTKKSTLSANISKDFHKPAKLISIEEIKVPYEELFPEPNDAQKMMHNPLWKVLLWYLDLRKIYRGYSYIPVADYLTEVISHKELIRYEGKIWKAYPARGSGNSCITLIARGLDFTTRKLPKEELNNMTIVRPIYRRSYLVKQLPN